MIERWVVALDRTRRRGPRWSSKGHPDAHRRRRSSRLGKAAPASAGVALPALVLGLWTGSGDPSCVHPSPREGGAGGIVFHAPPSCD